MVPRLELAQGRAAHPHRPRGERLQSQLHRTPRARPALLGLAFKPDIDDFRESPALEIALSLAKTRGQRIMVVEPFAEELPQGFAGTGAELVTLDHALQTAEIVVVLVDHTAFKHLLPADLAGKLVFDTRGMLKK